MSAYEITAVEKTQEQIKQMISSELGLSKESKIISTERNDIYLIEDNQIDKTGYLILGMLNEEGKLDYYLVVGMRQSGGAEFSDRLRHLAPFRAEDYRNNNMEYKPLYIGLPELPLLEAHIGRIEETKEHGRMWLQNSQGNEVQIIQGSNIDDGWRQSKIFPIDYIYVAKSLGGITDEEMSLLDRNVQDAENPSDCKEIIAKTVEEILKMRKEK